MSAIMSPTTSATGALNARRPCGRYSAHQGSARSGSTVSTIAPDPVEVAHRRQQRHAGEPRPRRSRRGSAQARSRAARPCGRARRRPAARRPDAPGRTAPAPCGRPTSIRPPRIDRLVQLEPQPVERRRRGPVCVHEAVRRMRGQPREQRVRHAQLGDRHAARVARPCERHARHQLAQAGRRRRRAGSA